MAEEIVVFRGKRQIHVHGRVAVAIAGLLDHVDRLNAAESATVEIHLGGGVRINVKECLFVVNDISRG